MSLIHRHPLNYGLKIFFNKWIYHMGMGYPSSKKLKKENENKRRKKNLQENVKTKFMTFSTKKNLNKKKRAKSKRNLHLKLVH